MSVLPKLAEANDLATLLPHRAREMIPMLRARAPHAAALGQVPAETIQAFKDAGFFRILQPRRYGGYELPPRVHLQVAEILAQGCMSTAWVYAVLAVHNWQLGLFDDRAARDVWGDDPTVLASSSYMPVGKVTPVDGGYRLSGHWCFSSGSAHASWVILGANMPVEKGAPVDPCGFLLPRCDYRIVENWDVMGLKGTGSNDIVVDDAFVPEHRVLRDTDMFNLKCPGHQVNSAALYRVPFAQIFNRTVAVTSLGSLRQALDTFIEATRRKLATYTGERLARDPTIQFAVCEVERILHEQTLVLAHDTDRMMELAQQDAWTIEERAVLGASATATVSRCVAAIDLLMQFSGAKAIYRGNPIQQAFLDIHCARAHVANNPFPYGRNLGGLRFGLENATFDI